MSDNKFDIYEERHLLSDSIQKFLDEEDSLKGLKTKVSDAMADIQSNLEYWIQSDMADNLAAYVQRMAEDAIEAILSGDEENMRRYLHCQKNGYTGRDMNHSIIRGKLFETGAVELRRQIVDAFPELLKNERILDLEDQLASVVKQYNELNYRHEKFCEQYR